MKKKPKKFYSQLELKMFKDKNVNKLKPIKGKKDKKDKNSNYNYEQDIPFIKSDTLKTDSTLYDLISKKNMI